ncbi:prolyl 4-hydroxylase subunit alpha-3 isoform X1 [Tachysurus fulvidraco]|uniref:prolyl 4-hydroxylase subunit alpha-3 isoform X1 n=1 Tax=Tachysurus fulvidraco TaxID=1234273 RepID=UPI001FEDED4F|nr:prolyl 4-hydroxylase subunit alpha-3 isoform X1 [Tachysurus fulvidraco]
MLCFQLLSLWFILHVCHRSLGEVYTSMMNIKQSILSERQLIDHLRRYLDQETQRLEDIKRFYTKVTAFHKGTHNDSAVSMDNPLAAFTLIKRLQSEWLNIIYSNKAEENVQEMKGFYKKIESNLPKLEDLQGAAQGLMRLQDVYSLQLEGMVKGHFQRVSNGTIVDIYKPSACISLSGDDCFLVGKVAYHGEDYYHSVQWLEEAVRLFRGINRSPENEGTLEDALDYLAFSHFKTGNIFSALSLSLELLHYDPSNRRVLLNVEKYEKLLSKSSAVSSLGSGLKRPSTTYLRTRDTYETLCQSQGSQPKHYENPRLFCDYYTNGSPGLLLQPMKRELVSLQPYVVLFHDFITGGEAHYIRESAMPALRRSVVASAMNQSTADYRISKSAWLKGSEHPTVSKVDRRISLLTGLNVQYPYAEHLQVVNYGIGGHYEPHFDHATLKSSSLYRLNSGNRMATFMIYLSSVEAGGYTAFIYANFSIPVIKNSAVFWWNLHRNGQGNGDTLHAGCPVLAGDKWVANKWVHEYGQEFRRPCSPNPHE